MKTLYLLLFSSLFSLLAYSQTQIIDSSVDWDSNPKTLTVYLSDSVVNTLAVKIGTTYGTNNILNATYTVGSNIAVADNMVVVDVSTITPGEYYVELLITLPDATTQLMQYQSSN